MKTIICVIGTRPEAIKMAPVVLQLRQQPWANVRVLATAQHREMLDQVLTHFGITPDIDLNIMRHNQSLTDLTARLLVTLGDTLDEEQPDAVLAQGDTTTVFAAALACFYRKIPFGHVEAGLRTDNLHNPFPEEANRVLAGILATWHFAPTTVSEGNLIRSNISPDAIYVTGNTVIDALLHTAESKPELGVKIPTNKRLVLITCHRRENFGTPFLNICTALETLAQNNPDVHFLYPVHPNPNIRDTAHQRLSGYANIQLCEPLQYPAFIAAMQRAYLIISDSGGVQEEAPALAKPVLVLRDETERPEALETGVVKLVGTTSQVIIDNAQLLLSSETAWKAMAKGQSPYGDGHAAERIAEHLRAFFLDQNPNDNEQI